MTGIFKAYDIRGIVRKDLTEPVARDIGRAFVSFLDCRRVVVGQDTRLHSELMFDALAQGITMQGADIIRLGLCSTPMSYFANGSLGADASIMITASHNPSEWNGFKLCREQAIPISGETGINEIEQRVLSGSFAPAPAKPGTVRAVDILPKYAELIKTAAAVRRPLKIAVDFANGMGCIEAAPLRDLLDIDPMYDTLDGSFPHHEANPLKTETLKDLQQKVEESGRIGKNREESGSNQRIKVKACKWGKEDADCPHATTYQG